MNIKDATKQAEAAGFSDYLTTRYADDTDHLIMTCLKGRHTLEVIDIYYNTFSGEVTRVEHSAQRKDITPTFRFNTPAHG